VVVFKLWLSLGIVEGWRGRQVYLPLANTVVDAGTAPCSWHCCRGMFSALLLTLLQRQDQFPVPGPVAEEGSVPCS
jgi:hypothetical protein